MKKFIAILIGITGLSFNAAAQNKNITGTWSGNITANLRLIFHFDKTKDDIFGTIDSPDQGVNGLPVSSIRFNGDSLFVEMNVAKAKYNALRVNDSTLSGIWVQGTSKIPLQIIRTTTSSNIKIPLRPQTPKPPFSYNADSVEYDNADKSVHYGATLTYPKSGSHFICAILITGSGLQDRDETIFYHKPFAVIADYLTRQGYAVLRVDDRTMGKSTGDVTHATSADFANDVIASIRYLETRPEIDSNKIGLIGHSEGGFIAPIVYTKWPKISFIISLAGTGVSGAEILLQQQTDGIKNKVSKAAFNSYYSLTKNTLMTIHESKNEPDSLIILKIKNVFLSWEKEQPDSILTALNLNEVTPEMYATKISPELKPWLRYFISAEPSQFWEKVKCPVLVLDGEKDIQVNAEENVPAIAGELQKAGNNKVTTKIFPGLNHLFQHCHACTVQEYGELEETFAPEVLSTMANWLNNNVMMKR